MKKIENLLKIKILGYITFGLGLLAFLEEHVFKFSSYSQSYNPGYGLAVCALVFLGMVSLVVYDYIKNMELKLKILEERISKIEGMQPPQKISS